VRQTSSNSFRIDTLKRIVIIANVPSELVNSVTTLFSTGSWSHSTHPYPVIRFYKHDPRGQLAENVTLEVRIIPPKTKFMCGTSTDVVIDLAGAKTCESWFSSVVRPMIADCRGVAIKV